MSENSLGIECDVTPIGRTTLDTPQSRTYTPFSATYIYDNNGNLIMVSDLKEANINGKVFLKRYMRQITIQTCGKQELSKSEIELLIKELQEMIE